MEILREQKATDEPSNSAISKTNGRKWKYPETKREAIDIKEIGARISLTKNMAGNLINLLQSMGADNEIPIEKKDRTGWLNQFHMQIAVNNPVWPEELPFGFVYGAFANALIYDRVALKGHNIHAFVSAFKRWITQSGIKDRLLRSYYKCNPEKAPKQIEDRESKQPNKAKADGYVDFSPSVVKEQIETLERIWGTAEEIIKAFPGGESYARRLYDTKNKMIDEGHWPDNQ